ncbi:MAG: pilus assembly protein TadE [Methylocystaceae bacterium]|nr:MAG: pilus assembly protein TadE [Methylocystaceae bacterium]
MRTKRLWRCGAQRLLGVDFRRFCGDRGGSAAIEFVIVSIPLLGLIAAIFEAGLVYFRSQQLQYVTQIASRAVLTHSAGNMTYRQFIDTYVCTWQSSGTVAPGTLSTAFDCSKLMVDIGSPTDWASASTANDFYTNPNSPGSTIAMPDYDSVAVVRIAYPLPTAIAVLTGGVLKGMTLGRSTAGLVSFNEAWTHMLMGVYAFKVEPK